MKKIIAVIILLFLAGAAWMYFNDNEATDSDSQISLPVQEEKPSLPATLQNDLPHMTLDKADGSRIEARNLQEKAVLIFFLPDCDHCQREAVQIRDNITSFKDYTLYFISSVPGAQLNQFANEYKLAGYTNVYFATTSMESIFKNYGPIPTPSLYIYEKGGRMVKSFKGETPIDNILASIK